MDDLEVIMNKRIISLSLGLLLLGNQMGLLAMDPQKSETEQLTTVEQKDDVVQKDDEEILVPRKKLYSLLDKLDAFDGCIGMQNDFIQNNGLGYEFHFHKLNLMSEDKKLAYIKSHVDEGMKPEDAQVLKYQLRLTPFSEIEELLSTLSREQLEGIFSSLDSEDRSLARVAGSLDSKDKSLDSKDKSLDSKNEEIDVAKERELIEKERELIAKNQELIVKDRALIAERKKIIRPFRAKQTKIYEAELLARLWPEFSPMDKADYYFDKLESGCNKTSKYLGASCSLFSIYGYLRAMHKATPKKAKALTLPLIGAICLLGYQIVPIIKSYL